MSTILSNVNNTSGSPAGVEAGAGEKEYETRLGFLYDVASQANSVEEVSALLKEIPSVIQRIMRASASSLFMIDDEKSILCLQAAGSDKSGMLRKIKLDLNSGIVGWVARHGTPVVVNDVSKDKHFNREVDEATGFVTKSVIAAPLLRRQKVIGVIEMVNKEDGGLFTDEDLGLMTEFASTEALILLVSMAGTLINNFRLCQSVQDEYRNTVETLVTAADAKDPYAHGHSRRVKDYVLMAVSTLEISIQEKRLMEFAALLHDIGKIGIDDRILRKTGPLTPEEWYIIRKHALKGAQIVSAIPQLEKAAHIILHHHERYDGKGYPKGLKGAKIPLGARLIAVADAFDTMTTDHSYRSALSPEKAVKELMKFSGSQFCSVAVKAFVDGFCQQKGIPVEPEVRPAPAAVAADETGETRPAAEGAGLSAREARKLAKEEARRQAEEAKKAKAAAKLAEKQARKVEAEEAKREARELNKSREAARQAEKEARKAAGARGKNGGGDAWEYNDAERAIYDIDGEMFQGDVQLAITRLVSFRQINQFRKSLLKVANLKIVSESWSENEGFIILISVPEPMPLGPVGRDLPDVERLDIDGKRLVAVLKAPEPEDAPAEPADEAEPAEDKE